MTSEQSNKICQSIVNTDGEHLVISIGEHCHISENQTYVSVNGLCLAQ